MLETSAKQIDKAFSEFRQRLLERLTKNIVNDGLVFSGNLVGSNKIEQDAIADDLSGGLILSTLKYGILTEAKRKYVIKASADEIYNWVKKIGVGNFRAYKKFATEDDQIKSIVWGIKQHGRVKKLGTDSILNSKNQRRSKHSEWFHKTVYAEIKQLERDLTATLDESFARDISRAIQRQVLK